VIYCTHRSANSFQPSSAARIMDTAEAGQILASSNTVVPKLNTLLEEKAEQLLAKKMVMAALGGVGDTDGFDEDALDCEECPRMKYDISAEPSEVIVKHGVTTCVQSITCALHSLPRPEDLPPELRPEPLPPWKAKHDLSKSMTVAEQMSAEAEDTLRPLKDPPGGFSRKKSFASLSSLQPNQQLSLPSQDSGESSLASASSAATTKPLSSMHPRAHSCGEISQHRPNDEISNRAFEEQQKQRQRSSWAVGVHATPKTKWYMKIKPTEMHSVENLIKPKVLPQELIRRHKRIAFLGIMHDNLSKGFTNTLEQDPDHRWEQVYVFFPSDKCLYSLAKNYPQPVEKLIENKHAMKQFLSELLSPVVTDLRFLQYQHLMHCGSYWDWKEPGGELCYCLKYGVSASGLFVLAFRDRLLQCHSRHAGFIHISPLTWGANPKTCPAMNYYWNSTQPSPEYRVYRDGLEYLLGKAKPFTEEVADSTIVSTS
jgi:hypothetical protein